MQKKEQESKARIDWIQKDIENRKRMRLMEENVSVLYTEGMNFKFKKPLDS